MPNCDIVIPVWGHLAFTKKCIEQVETDTSCPYRLIIIDNASDQKTREYLEALAKRLKGRMVLIKNQKNEGFIKAVNKGIAFSNAEFVCILNNDTIVTAGWLGEMLKLFEADPKIGIVNPSSNSLGQKIPKGTGLTEFAGGMKSQAGRFVEIGSALGFCMLMKRKLFSEIGYFDETYGRGNFDDTDFSLRTKRHGYKMVRAFASYVYHKEQGSFKAVRNFRKDFAKNKKLFESRWGSTKRVVVVFKDINRASLMHLNDIFKKHAREKSWVYVISPAFETKEFFRKFSNLTFLHYRRAFYLLALLRIMLKKKKPDIVYGDNSLFLATLKTLRSLKTEEISV